MATAANPTPRTHAPVTPVLSCKNSLSDVRFGGAAITGDVATSVTKGLLYNNLLTGWIKQQSLYIHIIIW